MLPSAREGLQMNIFNLHGQRGIEKFFFSTEHIFWLYILIHVYRNITISRRTFIIHTCCWPFGIGTTNTCTCTCYLQNVRQTLYLQMSLIQYEKMFKKMYTTRYVQRFIVNNSKISTVWKKLLVLVMKYYKLGS